MIFHILLILYSITQPRVRPPKTPRPVRALDARRRTEQRLRCSGLESDGRPRPPRRAPPLTPAPGGCSGLGPPPPLPLPAAPRGRAARPARRSAAAAAASRAAASAGGWSALEFERGPGPSQRHLRSRPPPPSSNSRSLRHSASHRPRAAGAPCSQSRGRLLNPPRRRRSPHAPAPAIGPIAGPDGSCSPRSRGRRARACAGRGSGRREAREARAATAAAAAAREAARSPLVAPGPPRADAGAAGEAPGARRRQLCQSLPPQGPAGAWGRRAVQLRQACPGAGSSGAGRAAARRRGPRVTFPSPPNAHLCVRTLQLLMGSGLAW
ncbi:unnamed protein product [Nyctereutes procyonoides]|uniref:(raccoon dog) hypothetical protein n=1 Tax=Nyctereutes procyonoides TaxID=34880 RepID=A0A811YEI8_NYCPR|nr:unnamed protein product [Nyctereutes procyonoides]